MIIEKGIVSESYILMPKVDVPKISFTEGFKISENQVLKDQSGKMLIEAFALDLIGDLQLPKSKQPGVYEIALISDDGSLLDIDLDDNGAYTRLIDNDGYHSASIKCGSLFVDFSNGYKYPIRLRYYQGPRTAIALTLMMRRVDNAKTKTPGFVDSSCYSGFESDDFATELGIKGWFIPGAEAFALPEVDDLELLGTDL